MVNDAKVEGITMEGRRDEVSGGDVVQEGENGDDAIAGFSFSSDGESRLYCEWKNLELGCILLQLT